MFPPPKVVHSVSDDHSWCLPTVMLQLAPAMSRAAGWVCVCVCCASTMLKIRCNLPNALKINAMTILIEGFNCNCNYYLNYCHYFTEETSMLKLQNLFHLQTSFWHPGFNAKPNHGGCQDSEAVDLTVPASMWSVRNSKATCFLVRLPMSCWSKWSHWYWFDCKIFLIG